MIWRYHPEAAEEFLEACIHYSQISPDLGRAFYASIEGSIEKIVNAPRTWPVIEDGVRRFVVQRFPYGVYYTPRITSSRSSAAMAPMVRNRASQLP
jgi:toxin ParE1/3/4